MGPFKKVDWTWLLVGLVLGYVLHIGCTHPKSPLSGAFNFYYGAQ